MPTAVANATLINEAIEILRSTNDGNDLAPSDLYLVQEATNNNLNDEGRKVFLELHARVKAGKYTRPWLFDIEHLTIDHSGRVFWKGIEVEHYVFLGDNNGRLHDAATKLAALCRHLEEIGVPVTQGHAIWHSTWFETMSAESPYKSLLAKLPGLYQHPERGALLVFPGRKSTDPEFQNYLFVTVSNGNVAHQRLTMNRDDLLYHFLMSEGYLSANCGQHKETGSGFAALPGVETWLQSHQINAQNAPLICEFAQQETQN